MRAALVTLTVAGVIVVWDGELLALSWRERPGGKMLLRIDRATRSRVAVPHAVHVDEAAPHDVGYDVGNARGEWQSVERCVTVQDDDFEYQGRPYKSLSAIARGITGTIVHSDGGIGVK